MALKFQIRGTSVTPRYAAAKKSFGYVGSGSTPPTVLGFTGVFGGSALDMGNGPTAGAGPCFTALDNWVVNTRAASLLFRIVPKWASGNPPTSQDLIQIGHAVGAEGGIAFVLQSDGMLRLIFRNQNGDLPVNTSSAVAFTFVQNQPTDIWVCWDGEAGSDVEVWQAQHGVAPTKIWTGAAALQSDTHPLGMATSIVFGRSLVGAGQPNFYLNEFCIFDTKVDPATLYGARADFVTAADYEGYNFTALTAPQVQAGLPFGPGPGTLTGTQVAAAAATTKIGVTANDGTGTYDGSDRWTPPAAGNYRQGAADLKNNSVTANLVGTLVVPSLANTKIGVAGDGGTGTYDGSDRYTDFGNANILSGVAGRYNSLVNNRLGTLIQVTNEFTRATVQAQSPLTSEDPLYLSQGDELDLPLSARVGLDGDAFDLTAAVFTSYLMEDDSEIASFPNSQHTIDNAAGGLFTLSMLSTDTADIKLGKGRELVTKVVQGSKVTHFHGLKLITVLDNEPVK